MVTGGYRNSCILFYMFFFALHSPSFPRSNSPPPKKKVSITGETGKKTGSSSFFTERLYTTFVFFLNFFFSFSSLQVSGGESTYPLVFFNGFRPADLFVEIYRPNVPRRPAHTNLLFCYYSANNDDDDDFIHIIFGTCKDESNKYDIRLVHVVFPQSKLIQHTLRKFLPECI